MTRWYTLRPRTPQEIDALAFTAFHAWCIVGTKEKDAREVWAALNDEARDPWRRVAARLLEAGEVG